MWALLRKDPTRKLQAAYEATLSKAMEAQRNGDIRTYSELTEKANTILKQIEGHRQGQQ